MDSCWEKLYEEAKSHINVNGIPPFIEYGNNSCAILGENNRIYTGTNLKTNTSLYNSAEKTATILMFNDGCQKIKRMVILNELEEVILPSVESIEYLIELTDDPKDLLILSDYDEKKYISLEELIPNWWGTFHNHK